MNKQDELQAQRNELFDHSSDTLARIKELDKELQAVIDKKKEPEEFYQFGDRFTAQYSKVKAILAAVGNGEVMMINLSDGGRWGSTRKTVKDIWNITQSEFDGICHDSTFTRYYDARKQAKVGDKSEQGKSEDKDEPKLRHGDYGTMVVDEEKVTVSFFYSNVDGTYHHPYRTKDYYYGKHEVSDVAILGHIFDDLTAKTEMLSEYKIDAGCFGFKVNVGRGGEQINMNTQGCWMSIETAEEIYAGIGQVINYAKSQKKG